MAIELLPFEITYKPCRAIKSQVLSNFIAEWTETELRKEYITYSNWVIFFDGSKMLAGLGAGVILTSPTGDAVRYVLQIMYTDSNNAAEYEALLHGLRMAVSMGITPRGTWGFEYRDISNKWRIRCKRSKDGSLPQCRTQNIIPV